MLQGVILDVDPLTGKAQAIRRLQVHHESCLKPCNDIQTQLEVIKRGAVEVLPEEELVDKAQARTAP